MGAQYISRETAGIAAADTEMDVNTLGAAAAAEIMVPSGKTRIGQIIAAFATDGAATGATVVWLHLSGNGIVGGEQTIMIGGAGGTNATTDVEQVPAMVLDVNIDVVPGNIIDLNVQANVDTGTASCGVTLVFP